ncbi:ABC transporter ATP-binding protein [Winogradskya humida]|uniref:Multidrug ABC transporter ATP-binding protein n=1 Tax=Winogradskya humida TaxID=113566 RepID=A0ABQ4A5K5_9ACTN|nr:ABC transporter ATP-binding protein [Actinoplanes humidus]GIE26126.1 multidrug ABC transporter ATP-binding protein [Actinoplanes humidus]
MTQSTPPRRSALPRLAARLRPQRSRLLLVVVLTIASVGTLVAGPWILGLATDVLLSGLIGRELPEIGGRDQAVADLRAQGHDRLADMLSTMNVTPTHGVDLDHLGRLLLLATAVFVLSAVFSWIQGFLMAGITQRTIHGLRRSVEEKMGRLPLRYFDRNPHGEILSRTTNDVDNINVALQEVLGQLPTAVLTVLGVLVVMFWISPLLAAVSLITVPLLMVALAVFGKRSKPHFTAQWEHTGHLTALAEETYSGHALMLAFGRRATVIESFGERNEKLRRASFYAQFFSGLILPAVLLIGNLNYVTIAVLGGYQVATGVVSLGSVQAFIQYSRRFTTPITQIAGQLGLIQSGLASAERVFEFLDAPEESTTTTTVTRTGKTAGRIELRNVSFRYEPGAPLIEDLTLDVAPGQKVAIVGPTGSGKTTLVNLLMRFYEIDDGQILLDGTDYRDLSRDEVRACFGMVLQETWLFGGTIRENIAYGRQDVSDEDVRAAARDAFVDDFVRTLPDGYDTVLDEDASSVSTGQKQLLTIARAFLADPDILILDEATSSVDTRTELMIQQAMTRLCAGRTSFVIAHRLSTVRDADTIVVIDAGRVTEQGSHVELLARRSFYHHLYNSQFAATS